MHDALGRAKNGVTEREWQTGRQADKQTFPNINVTTSRRRKGKRGELRRYEGKEEEERKPDNNSKGSKEEETRGRKRKEERESKSDSKGFKGEEGEC